MIRMPIPLVVDEYFFLSGKTEDAISFRVGSPAWFRWLADTEHRSFSLRCHAGGFTARHEQQRHGWYWYAYRKRGGKSYKIYLGKAEDVTSERLYEIAARLASKGISSDRASSSATSQPSPLPAHMRAIKFSVPSIETPVVPRPHILSLLEAGRKNKLILLSAGAGWGKTVLLSSWCSLLSRQNIPFAWISLDQYDNDPVLFWTSLVTALQTIHPGLGQKELTFRSLDLMQQALLDECMALPRESLLVLDDVHYLTSPESLRALAFFLEHLPPQLHLVIASRNDPPLPLARLRVQGKLLEIRSADLALGLPEIATLLHEVLNSPLSSHDYSLLARQTEGWPAGVHLAALMLKDLPDPTQGLRHFSGSTHSVFDYFLEEVVLPQSAEVQEFLLQTSILTQLSSSLCDAVCASNNSQTMLEYLRQNNLFLQPFEAQGLQYRYHPLFQQALQARLRQQFPLLESDLYQRATLWYEQHPISGRRKSGQLEQPSEESSQSLKSLPIASGSTLPVNLLTDRERDVLALLLHGASNREIAQQLIISEGTTKKHIANICSKFHVQRRTQVITRMLEPALF